MSEDSIASESPCRLEAGAPLPPRKRLLAGFKQNGWSSPSSSSCAGPMEEMQVKANLEEGAMAKHEEQGHESVEDGERGAAHAPNCAEESMDSDNRRQSKSKRHRTSSHVIMKTKKKKKKVAAAEVKAIAAEKDLDTKVLSIAETEKDVDDVDAVAIKVYFEAEKVAIAPTERGVCAKVEAKEEKEDAIAACVLKSRTSKAKEELTAFSEALKPRRIPGSKAKEEEDAIAACDEALKPRRNPSRQNHSRNKDVEQKKQEAPHDRSSQMPPPLADEELARQLHRAMNSSPRISHCLSHKEDGPLLSSSRKHYPGG